MSDVTIIDARGRAAGAALREAAARRPIVARSAFGASTATHDHRPTRPSRLRPVLIAAFIVLLVAALVALTNRDPQPAQPTGPKDLRYLVSDVPEGWAVVGARDGGGVATDPFPGFSATLYGTVADPTAPTLVLQWVDHSVEGGMTFGTERFEGLIGTTAVEQFEVNGRMAGCGDRPSGQTLCIVDTERSYVSTQSRGISRSELRTALATLTYDGNVAAIDDRSLPTNVREVSTDGADSILRVSDTLAPEASAVRWTGSDGGAVDVTVIHDDGSSMTRYGNQAGWEPARIGTSSGFHLHAAIDVTTLVWLRDGKVFTVEASVGEDPALDSDELAMSFAEGLRPAGDEAWEALPDWNFDPIVQTPPTAATSTASTTPTTGESIDDGSSGGGSGGDVAVGLEHDPELGNVVTVWNTGHRVADDRVSVGLALDTFRITGSAGGVSGRLKKDPVLNLVPVDGGRGVFVITPVDGELVVIGQDGTRYLATPEDLFERPEARYAMVMLPVAYSSAQFVGKDGAVLAETPGPG